MPLSDIGPFQDEDPDRLQFGRQDKTLFAYGREVLVPVMETDHAGPVSDGFMNELDATINLLIVKGCAHLSIRFDFIVPVVIETPAYLDTGQAGERIIQGRD